MVFFDQVLIRYTPGVNRSSHQNEWQRKWGRARAEAFPTIAALERHLKGARIGQVAGI